MRHIFPGMEDVSVWLDDDIAVVVVHTLSDEIREGLRVRLSGFCYGAAAVDADLDFYSFENTIEQFLERFDSKTVETQVGMIGELLVHLLMPSTHPALTSSAVFFNKEERSIKKGFDLTFHEGDGKAIWYGEVKSGGVGVESADTKAGVLLKKAASDLADKLGSGAHRSRWESALIDADLTLQSAHASTVKALLRSDASTLKSGSSISRNAVLASAVFHDAEHCVLTAVETRKAVDAIVKGAKFDKVRMLVIQKTAMNHVVEFLRTELVKVA